MKDDTLYFLNLCMGILGFFAFVMCIITMQYLGMGLIKTSYQEECVQSHVEYTSTIIKANENIDNIVVYSQGSPIIINTTKMNKGDIQEITTEKEVCDKYQLVRYANEVKE